MKRTQIRVQEVSEERVVFEGRGRIPGARRDVSSGGLECGEAW